FINLRRSRAMRFCNLPLFGVRARQLRGRRRSSEESVAGFAVRSLLCVAALHCVSATAQSRPESWNQPYAPFTAIGNIHYVGTAGLSSFLITTERGHILLDGALPESVAQIEANIATLGFKLGDVKYLLNSHAHLDHSGSLAQLKLDSGAQLV